jgi:hypothetical protein
MPTQAGAEGNKKPPALATDGGCVQRMAGLKHLSILPITIASIRSNVFRLDLAKTDGRADDHVDLLLRQFFWPLTDGAGRYPNGLGQLAGPFEKLYGIGFLHGDKF